MNPFCIQFGNTLHLKKKKKKVGALFGELLGPFNEVTTTKDLVTTYKGGAIMWYALIEGGSGQGGSGY